MVGGLDRQLIRRWAFFLWVPVLLLLVPPLLAMFQGTQAVGQGGIHFTKWSFFTSPKLWNATLRSMILGFAAVAVALAIGIPIAGLLARIQVPYLEFLLGGLVDPSCFPALYFRGRLGGFIPA